MRIISGKYKHRHIPVPSSFKARPTTDFAKEGLFNIFANHFDFQGLTVLDLFAGTGSIGFEFASRGAKHVDMVEINPRYAEFIRSTSNKLAISEINVIRGNVFRFVPVPGRNYDIIFADPPYEMTYIDTIPDFVLGKNILHPEGWLILEHGRKNNFAGHKHFRELRKYGSVHFSIFIKAVVAS